MKNYLLNNKRPLSLVLLFAITLLTNQIAFSQYVCQPVGSPVVTNGSLTAGDPTQAGRIVRDGIPSSCTGKSNGLQNTTPVNYDSYNFTSPTTGCVTVDFNHTGCGTGTSAATTQVVAYSNFNPAAPNTGVIGDAGFSSTGVGSFSFPVTAGQTYTIVVHDILETPTNLLCANYSFTVSYSTNCRQAGFDKTNDGKADPTIWRPSNGGWYTINSAGGTSAVQFGQSGDITTPGDYTGDGQTDVSVYRPSNNFWYYGTSQTTPNINFVGRPYGAAGDIPVPGDYDRDGKTDMAMWRPSNGFWYALRSADNTLLSRQWGQTDDVPVIGDFDGDRINDFAVVRPTDPVDSKTRWYILMSNFNYGFLMQPAFGAKSDKFVPGDYDGDAKTDVAVWRPSTGVWTYIGSRTGAQGNFPFGQNGDVPQPADYDGDRRTDFAVWRPVGAEGVFYVNNSQNGTTTGVTYGASTDQPVTSPYKVQ